MATTCPHGYPQDTCIICQTLEASRNRPTTVAPSPEPVRPDLAGHRGKGPERQDPRGPEQQDPRGPERRMGFTPSILVVVLAVVAVVAVVWAVAGVVFAVLRIVELVATIVVAGGIGYQLGRARGRRER